MNRNYDWKTLLTYANQDLDLYGYSLLLKEDNEGYFACEVFKNGEFFDTYAENYWEDELADLINEAWHYIKTKLT